MNKESPTFSKCEMHSSYLRSVSFVSRRWLWIDQKSLDSFRFKLFPVFMESMDTICQNPSKSPLFDVSNEHEFITMMPNMHVTAINNFFIFLIFLKFHISLM